MYILSTVYCSGSLQLTIIYRTSSDSRESKEAASGRESESTPDKKAKLSDAQASCENTSTTVSSSASSQLGALSGLAAYSSSESDNGD